MIHANIPSFPTLTSSGNHPAVRNGDVSIRRETQICIVAAEKKHGRTTVLHMGHQIGRVNESGLNLDQK